MEWLAYNPTKIIYNLGRDQEKNLEKYGHFSLWLKLPKSMCEIKLGGNNLFFNKWLAKNFDLSFSSV